MMKRRSLFSLNSFFAILLFSVASASVSAAQCNWWGDIYPICASTQGAWGWENNQTCVSQATCLTQPAPYGVVNGGASSAPGSSIAASSRSSSSIGASSSAPATGNSCTGIAAWNSATVYWGNDRAHYNGVKYRAQWWTQGENPAQNPTNVWANEGACTGTASSSVRSSSSVISSSSSSVRSSSSIRSSSSSSSSGAATPIARHGHVCGNQLCNQNNTPVQLRGMSTHGIQWYGWGSCLNEASLDALAYDWKADILRISMYVQEGGYETNPVAFTAQVTRLIDEATERGMYALVDFHQLTPGDPNYNLQNAKNFFRDIVQAHSTKTNVIYDVANEPNGVSWAGIKSYAEQVIPVIRQYNPNAVVLVGTHGWASMGTSDGRTAQDIYLNPVNASNIMYTFHFYAASHGQAYRDNLVWAAQRMPVFVTEFGSQDYSGDGPNNFTSTQQYLDILNQYKISWTNWNYSDDMRSGAVWKTGQCSSNNWSTSNLKEAGIWIRNQMRSNR
jgi:endoglucanase